MYCFSIQIRNNITEIEVYIRIIIYYYYYY